jgi:hypothetical protein
MVLALALLALWFLACLVVVGLVCAASRGDRQPSGTGRRSAMWLPPSSGPWMRRRTDVR